MKWGDIVIVAPPGDFGKPRPALIIQSDTFDATGTVTVALMSGTPVAAPVLRIDVQPRPGNGLTKPSQVMVDKIMTLRREKVSGPVGRLDDAEMLAVTRSLALFLGFV